MNLGLLLANARLPELPSTYRAVVGAFSERRSRQVFFGLVQGRARSPGWMSDPPLELRAKPE
jgi:hypothetical protein